MTVFNRLKLELNNQTYFSEDEMKQFLIEQNLDPDVEFEKADMYKDLLMTVINILSAVANDINTMRSISTSFANIGQAYEFIEARIINLKDRIAAIPESDEGANSCFSLLYSRNRNGQQAYISTSNGSSGSSSGMQAITDEQIDQWFADYQNRKEN